MKFFLGFPGEFPDFWGSSFSIIPGLILKLKIFLKNVFKKGADLFVSLHPTENISPYETLPNTFLNSHFQHRDSAIKGMVLILMKLWEMKILQIVLQYKTFISPSTIILPSACGFRDVIKLWQIKKPGIDNVKGYFVHKWEKICRSKVSKNLFYCASFKICQNALFTYNWYGSYKSVSHFFLPKTHQCCTLRYQMSKAFSFS